MIQSFDNLMEVEEEDLDLEELVGELNSKFDANISGSKPMANEHENNWRQK